MGQLASVCTGTSASPGSTPPVAPSACTANSTTVAGYSESKTFDSLGRPLSRAIQIPGDTTYTYSLGYDPNTGLPSTLTYPTTPAGPALKLQYGYAYGILQSVTDITDSPNVTLWTATAQDPTGQITQETLGNQVQVNHALDAATSMLTGITAGKGGGTALQNQSFMFDGVGNLTQRGDNTLGFVENIYIDAANRLDHTTINGNPDMQMSYNPNGSINTRQFFAGPPNTDDYTSANSLVEESSNGSAGGTVTWTSFNQPSTIGGANGTSSAFFYGPDHQRWQQQAYYAGSAETTTYIGGQLEKVATPSGTVYRHLVPVGNSVVVYLPGASPTVQYVTGDHLGSTATITDINGNLVLAESFTPWGARRSPANWAVRQSAADAAALATTMRQGFTGHEHLDNLDLIDMNGRMYQGTGFMSPDPNIPDPTNPQDYNRYSYVDDNPLSLVDPSGFAPRACIPSQILHFYAVDTFDTYSGGVWNGSYSVPNPAEDYDVPVCNWVEVPNNSSGNTGSQANNTTPQAGCPSAYVCQRPQTDPCPGSGPTVGPASNGQYSRSDAAGNDAADCSFSLTDLALQGATKATENVRAPPNVNLRAVGVLSQAWTFLGSRYIGIPNRLWIDATVRARPHRTQRLMRSVCFRR